MAAEATLRVAAPRRASAQAVTAAAQAAKRAAAAAGVQIELASGVTEMKTVSEFFAGVWLTPESQPPLGIDVLRAMVHAEGAVHYARDGSGIAGGSAMIFCSPASRGVYSLIAGVRSSDHGVGFALKQAQRAWALERGATTMTWTFDPLVSRNARFNLVKLGAIAVGYAVDFFGPLNDGIDGQGETDRLIAVWSLTGRRAITAAQGRRPEAVGPQSVRAELDQCHAPDGEPFAARDDSARWCRVPRDIVALRRQDPGLAGWWRSASRSILLPAFTGGLVATGFSPDGWYHLTRQGPS